MLKINVFNDIFMKYFEINFNILYNAVQDCGKKRPNKFLD